MLYKFLSIQLQLWGLKTSSKLKSRMFANWMIESTSIEPDLILGMFVLLKWIWIISNFDLCRQFLLYHSSKLLDLNSYTKLWFSTVGIQILANKIDGASKVRLGKLKTFDFKLKSSFLSVLIKNFEIIKEAYQTFI